MSPIASIVIPAHNEASVISSCLQAFTQRGQQMWQVIVVCNGCTDNTAEIARAVAPWATVLNIETASKSAALNAGDAQATVFPRIYLDADIEVSADALQATVESLNSRATCVAAPSPYFASEQCPAVIKAFYRAWQRSDFMQDGVIGNGVYALSELGRRRFEYFPDVFGDDFFVYSLFRDDERRTLRDHHFTIHPPRTLKGLIDVRTRVYFGNAQLGAAEVDVEKADDSKASAIGLIKNAKGAGEVFDACVYLAINGVAKARAMVRLKRKRSATWDRDGSSRARSALAE